MLGYWRDRVSQPLALLRTAANDPPRAFGWKPCAWPASSPGVSRLELAYDILKYDTDYYLDYTFKETLRQLQKSARFSCPSDPKALARAVERLTDTQIKTAAGRGAGAGRPTGT